MKKNVGTTDQMLRVVVAIGALIVAVVVGFSSGWGIVLTIVAAALVVTGASGYCPLYSATGIDTLPTEGGHRQAMRISVSNWRTTEVDVDRSVLAILAALSTDPGSWG